MNLFRTRYVSVYLFLHIQTISGQAIFTNMNLTQVPVGQNDSEETDIDLSNNLIGLVEDNAFVLSPYLIKLFLDCNQISNLSDSAFNGTSIQDLSVSNNKLTALPRFASIGFSLQNLDASINLIEKIGKDEFKGVTGLQKLNISSNRLTFVHPEAFSDCANTMSWLGLGWNPSLTSISAEMFTGMGQLDLLDVQGGSLTSFPDFSYLPVNNSLTKLRIKSGQIEDLPTNALHKLGKLNDLILHSLGMTRVPDFSRQRDILQRLSLSSNNISDIPNNAFDNLPLINLYLSSNKLTRLPNLQSIQSTLERLTLSGNNFSTVTCEDIHEMVANCPRLNRVYFQNTNIKTFPDILQLNRSFGRINLLNQDSMRCDCAMEWMIGLEDQVATDVKGTSMPCAAPPRLVGRKWATINRTDLCHDNEAVSCNFKPPIMSTTSASIPSTVTPTDSNNKVVYIVGTVLGIVGIIGVVFGCCMRSCCRTRSCSSSNKSSNNKQEGEIVDGNSTYLEPAPYYTEPIEPPTYTNQAVVYDEIDDLALGPLAMGAQTGVVTGGAHVCYNVITRDATVAVNQNVN